MVLKRGLAISVVAICCSTTVLFSIVWIGWAAEWDPWMDVNEDGIVNVLDLYHLAQKYGTSGTSLEKAGLLYDTGWTNISNMQGQNITINHSLGIEDWNNDTIIAEVTGKTTEDGSLLRYLGLARRDLAWNKTYGGGSGYSMIESGGGYALLGTNLTSGETDFWLVKTDAAGNHQWNKTYGGADYDHANSVMQTSEEGYVVAGTTDSFGAGGSDFWLVQTDASGRMQCNKTYGGTDSEEAYCAVATSDGGYALVGYTASYGFGMWLVKANLNAECGLIWIDSSLNTIVLYRGTSDPYWIYLRVRILRKKY